MLVKDLIKLLNKQPSDFQVVLSKDSEGNGFSPVSGYGIGFYLSASLEQILHGDHGDFTDVSCTTFDKNQMEKAQDAIALYPAQ